MNLPVKKNRVPSLLENIFKVRKKSGQQLPETDLLQAVQIANVLFGHSCQIVSSQQMATAAFKPEGTAIAIITSVVR